MDAMGEVVLNQLGKVMNVVTTEMQVSPPLSLLWLTRSLNPAECLALVLPLTVSTTGTVVARLSLDENAGRKI